MLEKQYDILDGLEFKYKLVIQNVYRTEARLENT